MKTPKLFLTVGRDNRLVSVGGAVIGTDGCVVSSFDDIHDSQGKPFEFAQWCALCCDAAIEETLEYLRQVRNDLGYEFAIVVQRQA